MRWLFVVFVVSLCALLWAAIAVARHVRRDRNGAAAEAGMIEMGEHGTGLDQKPEQRLSGAESGDENT